MSEIKDGGPAFPTPFLERDGDVFMTNYDNGMSLRDYFAAKAMQGLVAALPNMPNVRTKDEEPVSEDAIARQAYAFADSMLAAREAK